jgi:hypothetical protein
MRAKELMIGDWVYSTFCDKPCKVIGIEQYESEYVNVKVTNVTGAKDINSLYFIPLTAEILEKNGFSKTTEAEFNYYQMPDDCFEIDINNVGCAYSVDVIIKYVHQLQHALRLCGINKEIVL